MALTTDGDLYSWGLNFKGQLGVGDFENRPQLLLIDSFNTGGAAACLSGVHGSAHSQQTKKYLVQMLKRSKSKETSASGVGSQTQRINPSSVVNEVSNGEADSQRQLLVGGNAGIQNGHRNANLLQGSSASKSIFNASFKELKPSKSVDLTNNMSQADGNGSDLAFGNAEEAESLELFLFKPQEKVV